MRRHDDTARMTSADLVVDSGWSTVRPGTTT
jgi:hypothetical protein